MITVPDVSAIVVNYNAGKEIHGTLHSIVDELASCRWECVVVDNASSDDSLSIAATFAPQVSLIRNDRNIGFARGVNQGLAATRGRIVLIINPDCRLGPGVFLPLRTELERSGSCGVVGPCILDPDGAVQGSARGDPDLLTGLFGRSALLRRVFPNLAVSRRNVVSEPSVSGTDAVVVDWVSGACMLARREAIESVGGFDERYFLYWEDADLCRRLRARGYHVRYVPAATAIHRVGQSSRSVRASAIRAFHESAYLYYATHVAPHSWPRRLLARALLSVRCWAHLRFGVQDSPRARTETVS